jgi:hypothetical protein
VPLPQFQSMPLGRIREPFSHPEWLFEIKWDGFRSLAYLDNDECQLISRNGNQFKSFSAFAEALPGELGCFSAVLDEKSSALTAAARASSVIYCSAAASQLIEPAGLTEAEPNTIRVGDLLATQRRTTKNLSWATIPAMRRIGDHRSRRTRLLFTQRAKRNLSFCGKGGRVRLLQ